MKTNGSLLYNICLAIGDSLALIAAFSAAWLLRIDYSDKPFIGGISGYEYLAVFISILPFWIITFALLGLYNHNIYEKRFTEFYRLLVGCFIGLLFIIFWEYALNRPIFPARIIPVYGFVFGFIGLLVLRTVIRAIRTQLFRFNKGVTNIILVGNTSVATEMANMLSDSSRSGYRILGIVGDKRRSEPADFTDFSEAIEHIKEEDIHGIIQTELYPNEDRNREILGYAQQHHISYRFVPGNTELFVGNIKVDLFRSSIPVIAVHQTPLLGWGQIAKRLFDIFVSSIMIIITSPLLLLIALLTKSTTRGSILFKQKRVTRFNQTFKVYKFRSQYAQYDGTTPEEAFAMMGKPELSVQYRSNGDQLDNDPRVTPLGKFLRKTSLDELPQFFNVLRGDISLVGPRPLIPQEISLYNKKHTILSVKPGLTGLAVVSGRRDISFEERRKLDIYYVQNWSFWLDIVILFKTIRVVLARKGAK